MRPRITVQVGRRVRLQNRQYIRPGHLLEAGASHSTSSSADLPSLITAHVCDITCFWINNLSNSDRSPCNFSDFWDVRCSQIPLTSHSGSPTLSADHRHLPVQSNASSIERHRLLSLKSITGCRVKIQSCSKCPSITSLAAHYMMQKLR
jgi:hypothetical protein